MAPNAPIADFDFERLKTPQGNIYKVKGMGICRDEMTHAIRKPIHKEVLQMRELGKQIFDRASSGILNTALRVEVLRKGEEITQSPNFKFLKGEEIAYTATNDITGSTVTETWMRVMKGAGVTILALVDFGRIEHVKRSAYERNDLPKYKSHVLGRKHTFTVKTQELPVLIYKPQPSVENWSVELPSGAVGKDISVEDAARRELREETGLNGESIIAMQGLEAVWHAPHRLNTTDSVMVVKVSKRKPYLGRTSNEKEEAPISAFIASWPEIAWYMHNNTIKYAMSLAAIQNYLIMQAPADVLAEIRRAE